MDAVLSSSSAWVWRDAVTAVFWLAVAALAIGTARRAVLWRTGLAAPVAWRGLLAIPKRYFVDLHHVVAREPAVARAHVAVAGGAIACLALVAINDGLRLRLRELRSPAVERVEPRLDSRRRKAQHRQHRLDRLILAALCAGHIVRPGRSRCSTLPETP